MCFNWPCKINMLNRIKYNKYKIMENYLVNSNDELVYIKSHSFSYIYKYDIEEVWKIIKDVDKIYEALKEQRSPPEYSVGNNSYTIGSKFSYYIKNFRKLNNETIKVIEEEKFKKVCWQIEDEPTENRFQMAFSLFKLTIENASLFKWDFIYDEKKGSKFKKFQLEKFQNERNNAMKRLDKYLSSNFSPSNELNLQNISQSIVLKCKLKYLWKIITNFANFQKLSPDICSDLLTVNDIKELVCKNRNSELKYANASTSLSKYNHQNEGDVFYVRFDNLKGVSYSKVKVVRSIFSEKACEYKLEIFELSGKGDKKERQKSTPTREFKFKILSIESNTLQKSISKAFLEYSIIFIKPVDSLILKAEHEKMYNVLIKLKSSLKKLLTMKSENEQKSN